MRKILATLLIITAFSVNAYAEINLNTASRSELESLKGIGSKKAKAIIDYRKNNGDFNTVSDLKKVSGIGPGILKKIRTELTVNGQSNIEKSSYSEEVGNRSVTKKSKRVKKQYDIQITTHQP